MYTTELDKSQYTPEQIAAAEKIAAIIESEKNQLSETIESHTHMT